MTRSWLSPTSSVSLEKCRSKCRRRGASLNPHCFGDFALLGYRKLRALSQALKASVNPLSDAFGDSEGRVAPLMPGFLVGQF